MTHSLSTPSGWTARRKKRATLFGATFLAAALLGLWAMSQPWIGISLGGATPTCSTTPSAAASTQVVLPSGDTTTMSVSGCISGYQSVHQEAFLRDLGVNPATVDLSPAVGAPVAGSKAGLPSATFWLLVAAALGALGCVVRNGAFFAGAMLPLWWSYTAFDKHRKALVYGLDPAPYAEMGGITAHSAAFVALCFLVVGGLALVLKVNHEQRALDLAAFKRGERDRPAGMTTIGLIAATIVRGQVDKAHNLLEDATKAASAGSKAA